MIAHIRLNQIHYISLVDMAREAYDFQIINENNLQNTHETVLHTLNFYVQQYIQQRIELVLYANTTQKMGRALRRRETDSQLTSVISNTLSTAELIWIPIQLDLEKKRNCTDSSINVCTEAQACWQRMQSMRSLNSSQIATFSQFLCQISSQLSVHLGQSIRSTGKVWSAFGLCA